jgi:hypothetical protein
MAAIIANKAKNIVRFILKFETKLLKKKFNNVYTKYIYNHNVHLYILTSI